jgi:hypothetical protein
LRAIKLKIDLKLPAPCGHGKPLSKRSVVRNAHSVRIQQQIVNSRIGLYPFHQFEKVRVQRGFPTGELENFDPAFAVNDALNAALQVS